MKTSLRLRRPVAFGEADIFSSGVRLMKKRQRVLQESLLPFAM